MTNTSIDGIDAIFTLGGQNPVRQTRSRKTLESANYLNANRSGHIPILISGHSGGRGPIAVTHAQETATPIEDYVGSSIVLEEEARDTFANMYFSLPLLKDMDARSVGLVTDAFHMYRALYWADFVFGDAITVVPITADERSLHKIPQETVALFTQRLDLAGYGMNKADMQGFNEYMHEIHPLHAQSPKPSLYGMLRKIK